MLLWFRCLTWPFHLANLVIATFIVLLSIKLRAPGGQGLCAEMLVLLASHCSWDEHAPHTPHTKAGESPPRDCVLSPDPLDGWQLTRPGSEWPAQNLLGEPLEWLSSLQSFEAWTDCLLQPVSPAPGSVPGGRKGLNKHLNVLHPAIVQIKKIKSRSSFRNISLRQDGVFGTSIPLFLLVLPSGGAGITELCTHVRLEGSQEEQQRFAGAVRAVPAGHPDWPLPSRTESWPVERGPWELGQGVRKERRSRPEKRGLPDAHLGWTLLPQR